MPIWFNMHLTCQVEDFQHDSIMWLNVIFDTKNGNWDDWLKFEDHGNQISQDRIH